MHRHPELAIVTHPWHLARDRQLVYQVFGDVRANCAVVFLPWASLVAQKGQYDFSHFDSLLSDFREKGISVLLRVLTAAGGRFTKDGDPIEPHLPKWIPTEYIMRGHNGQMPPREHRVLDFRPEANELVLEHYERVVRHFQAHFPDVVKAYALALSNENEIKYGQSRYAWRSYSDWALSEWTARGHDALPVVNGPRKAFSGHKPRELPLFDEFMKMRTDHLELITRDICRLVRAHGGKSMGMIGQFFQSHDGIFCNRAASATASYFDYVTVDYNYFNGWEVVYDDIAKPALMLNAMRTAGARKVSVGLYLERARERDDKGKYHRFSKISRAIDAPLTESIRFARDYEGATEFEVAGFGFDFGDAMSVEPSLREIFNTPSNSMPKRDRISVGILACHSNFDFFVADRQSNNRSLLRDTMSHCYQFARMRTEQLSVVTDVLVERAPLVLEQFDVLIIPAQYSVSDCVIGAVLRFERNGGVIVQDSRFGWLRPDGTVRVDRPINYFDISWRPFPLSLEGGGVELLGYSRFEGANPSVPVLSPRSRFSGTMHQLLRGEPGKGILGQYRRTITTGPLLWSLAGDEQQMMCETLWAQILKVTQI